MQCPHWERSRLEPSQLDLPAGIGWRVFFRRKSRSNRKSDQTNQVAADLGDGTFGGAPADWPKGEADRRGGSSASSHRVRAPGQAEPRCQQRLRRLWRLRPLRRLLRLRRLRRLRRLELAWILGDRARPSSCAGRATPPVGSGGEPLGWRIPRWKDDSSGSRAAFSCGGGRRSAMNQTLPLGRAVGIRWQPWPELHEVMQKCVGVEPVGAGLCCESSGDCAPRES